MKIQNIKRGFTLIELLVVITIMGILATGATAVYTSQIQKARDSTRITDMTSMRGAIEQVFQDLSFYPGRRTTIGGMTCSSTVANPATDTSIYCAVNMGFINAIPKDPKDSQSGNGSPLIYTYNVGDLDGVTNQIYEISNGVESQGMITSKATPDGGNDINRIEYGIVGKNLNTCVAGNTAGCSGTNSVAAANTVTSCSIIAAANNVVVIRGNCP